MARKQEHVGVPSELPIEPDERSQMAPVRDDDVPEGGYGWINVLAVFIMNGFTWGATAQSFGVILGYYLSNDVFPNATSIDYAFVGGFNLCMAMLVAPLVTVSVRHFGTRVTMLIGVVLQTAGFICASFASEVWQLYITQGAMVGFGIGFAYIPATAIIPQWFLKRRALASGIAAGGSGIGGIIYSYLTQALLDKLSLAWALRIVGISSGAMLVLGTALTRDRNVHVKPKLRGFDIKLLCRLQPMLILGWIFIGMFGYTTLLYSLPDFARSIGLTPEQAANISIFMNVSTTVIRIFIGFLADMFGIIEVTAASTLFTGVCSFAIWIPTESYGLLIFFSLAVGGTLGVFWPASSAIAPLCATVAGLEELPSLLSLSWMVSVLPLAFAEVIALKIRRPEASNAYLWPQVMSGISYILAGAVVVVLWRVHKKHGPIS